MKGYVYTTEVVIALAIVSVAFIAIYSIPPSKPDLEVSLLARMGHDSLEYLDNKGALRNATNNSDETSIENELLQVIGNQISYEIEICDENLCKALNVPVNETVVSADYYVSGFRQNFISKKVRIWLW